MHRRTVKKSGGGLRSLFRKSSASAASSPHRHMSLEDVIRYMESGLYDSSKDYKILQKYVDEYHEHMNMTMDYNRNLRNMKRRNSNSVKKTLKGKYKRYSLNKKKNTLNKKLKSVKKSKKSVTKLLKNKPPVPKRTSSSSSNKSRRWSQANESEKQKAKNELRRVMGH